MDEEFKRQGTSWHLSCTWALGESCGPLDCGDCLKINYEALAYDRSTVWWHSGSRNSASSRALALKFVAEDLARICDKNGLDITYMKGRESWHNSCVIWTWIDGENCNPKIPAQRQFFRCLTNFFPDWPTQISTQTWSWSLMNHWFLQVNWNGYFCIFDLQICTDLCSFPSSTISCCFSSSWQLSIDLEIDWIVQFNLCLRGERNSHIFAS